MFKSFLAVAVLVLTIGISDVQADPFVMGRTPNTRTGTPGHGTAINGPFVATPSGSLYEAVKPGNTSSDETLCIAAGADGCDGGAPAGGSTKNGGKKKSSKEKAKEKGEKIKEAVQAYVVPTSTKNFSLGNLNSDNEASLIISTGNEENNVIYRVIRLIAMLVGTVAILLYIVAGYFMIFSQGDENQLTKGKQILTFTSLGLVIVFGAYMLVQLVMGLMYFAS